MIHYMLVLGYILVTSHKNNIVTLHVTFMLYRRNKTCLLGKALFDLAIWQLFFVLREEYEIFFFDYYKYISS